MTFGDNLFCLLLLVLTAVSVIAHIMKSGEVRDGNRGVAEADLHSKLRQSASVLPLPPRAHAGFVSSPSPADPGERVENNEDALFFIPEVCVEVPQTSADPIGEIAAADSSLFSPERRHLRVPPLPAAGRRRERDGRSRLYGKPGPGGIRPLQFPCCPIDRQRNRKGCAQKIFWDRINDCYVCSYGHHFSRNGRLC